MTPIPAPSLVLPQEDWADTDFDLPDGDALTAQSDAESDNEDWDVEMDLGKTGGAKVMTSPSSSPLASTSSSPSNMITIRPPIHVPSGEQADDEDDCDDEGASTIKVTHMPPIPPRTPPPQDEDIENAFELPSDLSQLSLRPLSLHHRSSKTSLEWGDRDHTSSSTSSDAYSTLGFGPSASPSSNSTSAPSAGGMETDDDDDDDDDGELEGLVLPTGLFDSGHSGKQLCKILEAKKRLPVVDERIKVASLDSEDDFEIGLVIDDDFDLSPSRLPSNRTQPAQETKKTISRSKSAPPRPPTGSARPISRILGTKERAKSPTMTSASTKSLRSLALSPPVASSRPTTTRASTLQNVSSAPPSSMNSTFIQSPTSGPLRPQKSHSVLKPPSPRGAGSSSGHLSRKASLSSLIDTTAAGPSSSSLQSPTLTSYNAPTAASRARMQQPSTQFNPHSTTRLRAPDFEHQFSVPPTRPSTPSANTAALRLTMPTSSSRAKARPAISSVFGTAMGVKERERASSPIPPRPSSTASNKASSSRHHQSSQGQPHSATAAKVLRRPKRARTYGDGTELDGIEDLPTDREKEGRFRVVPKGVSAVRLSKGSSEKELKGTSGRKAGRRDGGDAKPQPATPATNTLRRKERIDFSNSKHVESQPRNKRKKSTPQTPSNVPGGTTRRKPTLIRNLGGTGAPKVVGDMKWNPQTLRWEGNDQALRDFDAATSSSTRPALITHLTGSSIGSPVTAFASGARVVGNMIFDPTRMCWISRLPPEEDEPDVFADLADDEDEWEGRGGTIRAGQPLDQSLATVATRGDTPSPGRPTSSHSRAMSESGSERGARPALTSLMDVDGKLLEKCRIAEDRHRAEMKGWRLRVENDEEPDRSSLYEIRALATRQY